MGTRHRQRVARLLALAIAGFAATNATAQDAPEPLPPHARLRLGDARLRHGALAYRLVASSDRRRFATMDTFGSVVVWDAETGREVCRHARLSPGQPAIALSADGGRAATIDTSKGDLVVFDATTGADVAEFAEAAKGATALRFLAGGDLVALGGADGTVAVWDLTAGREVESGKGHEGAVVALLPGPVLEQFLSIGADGKLVRWKVGQLARPETVFRRDGGFHAEDMDAARHQVALACADGAVLVLDAEFKARPMAATHEKGATTVAFSPDGGRVISGGVDRMLRASETATGKALWTTSAAGGGWTCVVVGTKAPYLVAPLARPTGAIGTFDLATGAARPSSELLPGAAVSFAATPDGRRLAIGAGGSILVFDLPSRDLLRTVNVRDPDPRLPFRQEELSLALSRDGATVYECSGAFEVRSWDVAMGAEGPGIRSPSADYERGFLSGDGRFAVACTHDRVEVWNVAAAKPFATVPGARGSARSAVFAVDGSAFVLLEYDSMRLLRTRDAKELGRIPPVGLGMATALAADGHTFASVGGLASTLVVGNLGDGRIAFAKTLGEFSILTSSISPDGKVVATGHRDGSVRLWDGATGRELTVLAGHRGAISVLTFLGDGSTLVSGAGDATAVVWDVTGAVAAAPPAAAAKPLALDRDGEPLPEGAIARLGTTRFRGVRGTSAVVFAPDGSWVASGIYPGGVQVWETKTGRRLRTLDTSDTIDAIAVAPDGSELACVGPNSHEVERRDPSTGRGLPSVATTARDRLRGVAYSPDDKILAAYTVSDDGKVGLAAWDRATAKLLYEVSEDGLSGDDLDLQFVGDGAFLAAPGTRGGIDLRDAKTGRVARTLPPSESYFLGPFAFSSDGERVAVPDGDPNIVRIRGAKHFEDVLELGTAQDMGTACEATGASVRALKFSPDGKLLAVVGHAGSIGSIHAHGPAELRIFDTTSGALVRRWTSGGSAVESVAFSADGLLVAWVGRSDEVHVARLPGLEPVVVAAGHGDSISAVTVLADGTTVVTASGDGSVRTWDLASGAPKAVVALTEQAISGLDVAPDGSRLALVDADGGVAVLDGASGRRLFELPLRYPEKAEAVALLAGGDRLCIGVQDGSIRLAEMATGHTAEVKAAASFDFGARPPRLVSDGRLLYCGPAGLSMLDPRTVTTTQALPQAGNGLHGFAVDRTGTLVVVVGPEGDLLAWDVVTGTKRFRVPAPEGFMGADRWRMPAVSPAGSRVAACPEGGAVTVWDGKTGRSLAKYATRATCLAFSPDGCLLVVGQGDSTALVFAIP